LREPGGEVNAGIDPRGRSGFAHGAGLGAATYTEDHEELFDVRDSVRVALGQREAGGQGGVVITLLTEPE